MTILRKQLESLHRIRRTLRKRRQAFWQPPDRLLLSEGATGELTMARVRFLVVGVILAALVFEFSRNPAPGQVAWVLWVGTIFAAISIAALIATQRALEWRGTGFVSSALDVSLITSVLVIFLVLERPHAAVNSRVLFSTYFVVIAGTSLRYDKRICVLAGLLAIGQYASVVAFAWFRWDLDSVGFAPFYNGTFDLNIHYARLVLLVSVMFVSTVSVTRAQTLRGLSAKDPLTGLMARGFFDERAAAEAARTVRYGRQLSVAMIDIDHFKRFNDTYGHAVGDEVLRVVGGMLRSVRQSDLVARYGGEEFIIVFPETAPEAAMEKAEELRKLIEPSMVTVSIGIAGLPADGEDVWMVIDKADQRLYEAKQGGRNQVVGPPEAVAQAA